MNRYKTLILVTVISLMGGCAELQPVDIMALTDITFKNWVAEHAPDATVFVDSEGKEESGIYIKYLHRAPQVHDSLKVEDKKWLRYDLTAFNMSNKTLMISDSLVARQAGTWRYQTHWAPMYTQLDELNPNFILPSGIVKVLPTLNIGDKIRLYLASEESFVVQPNLSNGNFGELTLEQFMNYPSYVDFHLVDVNNNAYTQLIDSMNNFALHKWNLQKSDTIGEEGIFMKKTITNTTGDPIAKDTMFSMNVTRYFLDGFMYSTTSDSIARLLHRYNPSDTETTYAKIRGTTQAMDGDPNLPRIYSIAPLHMRKGETALFLVNPFYTPESYNGAPSSVPALMPYEATYYEVVIDTVTVSSTSGDLDDPQM